MGFRFQHGLMECTGLADMCLGELLQAVLILAVGKGGIENIDKVELGDAGGHGTAAEGGLVGRGIELVVG